MKTLGLIIGSVLIGFPIAFIGTFLLTPMYWKLEPILGIELAGHSGPSDWIFELNSLLVTGLVFLALRLAVRSVGSRASKINSSPQSNSDLLDPE